MQSKTSGIFKYSCYDDVLNIVLQKQNDVKRINLCLDKDARKDSIKIYEKLYSKIGNDIQICFVELTKKDPNEIGFEEMYNLIKNSKEIDFSFLITEKML